MIVAEIRKTRLPDREPDVDAEALAVDILVYLAHEPDLLGRFSALTGIEPGDLRAFAGEPGFPRAMIGFLAGHEPTLIDYCRASGTRPETILAAWQAIERQDMAR